MKRKGKYRQVISGLGAVLLAAGLLGGCGSAAGDHSAEVQMKNNNAGAAGYAQAEEEALDMMPAAESGISEAGGQSPAPEAAVSDRKLIKTVDLQVETREFDVLLPALEDQVKAAGGYIEELNTYNGSAYGGRQLRNASLTVRIPRDQLDAFVQKVEGAGNIVSRSEREEDVTLTYVDLESHRKALETEQGRLLELLARAEKIEDIIAIEQRMSDVRYQIESMESQLRTYDNKVEYSTVHLYVDEVRELTPVQEESALQRIAGGFMQSLKDIGNGFKEVGIWAAVKLPYLVLWAVLITGIVLAARRITGGKRKKRSRAEDGQEPPAGHTESGSNHAE